MEEQNQQQPAQPEKPKKKFYKRWWFWAAVVFLAIYLYISIYYGAEWEKSFQDVTSKIVT